MLFMLFIKYFCNNLSVNFNTIKNQNLIVDLASCKISNMPQRYIASEEESESVTRIE